MSEPFIDERTKGLPVNVLADRIRKGRVPDCLTKSARQVTSENVIQESFVPKPFSRQPKGWKGNKAQECARLVAGIYDFVGPIFVPQTMQEAQKLEEMKRR